MKEEHGVTLAILAIYIIVFSVVIALLASLSNYIYGNLDNISDSAIDLTEFNKFNMYFIEDVKTNKEAIVSTDRDENNNLVYQVAFADGDIYSYNQGDDSIYKNNQKIASDILNFEAEKLERNEKSYIKVYISVGTKDNASYTKSVDYVLKYW